MKTIISRTLYVASGFGIGYIFARSTLSRAYAERTDREITETREFYKALYKKDVEDLTAGKTDLHSAAVALQTYQTGDDIPDVDAPSPFAIPEATINTAYALRQPEPAPVEEKKVEKSDPPRIITYDYFSKFPTHAKNAVDYYVGDDIVCGLDEKIISPEIFEKSIGRDNLQHLVEQPEGDDVIYVFYERWNQVFEVTRNFEKYSEAVLGQTE